MKIQYCENYKLFNFSYIDFPLDSSSTQLNDSATVTTVPSTAASVASVSNNVVLHFTDNNSTARCYNWLL